MFFFVENFQREKTTTPIVLCCYNFTHQIKHKKLILFQIFKISLNNFRCIFWRVWSKCGQSTSMHLVFQSKICKTHIEFRNKFYITSMSVLVHISPFIYCILRDVCMSAGLKACEVECVLSIHFGDFRATDKSWEITVTSHLCTSCTSVALQCATLLKTAICYLPTIKRKLRNAL